MDADAREDEADAQPAGGRRVAGESRFALLGETLLTGVLVLVGSLPVVTLPAALAAGSAHLRRHLGGYDTSVRTFARDWLAAARGLWALGALLPLAAGAVVLNTGLTASGALPGASVVRWVTWGAAACAAVVLVRAAAAWSDDEPAPGSPGASPGTSRGTESGSRPGLVSGPGGAWVLVSRGAVRARDDLAGSALVLAALVMCVVLVWMLTPLVLVTGGLLSLAAVAVETRRVRRRALG
ncbi:Poxvirus protein I5 [Promicromonospora sp. NPDC060271]|uniref:Poxvirus protein I5 n=1 Tax=Promicromonospora sp. NPDC060271 TaxID=3347089 RepID=UPI0036536715